MRELLGARWKPRFAKRRREIVNSKRVFGPAVRASERGRRSSVDGLINRGINVRREIATRAVAFSLVIPPVSLSSRSATAIEFPSRNFESALILRIPSNLQHYNIRFLHIEDWSLTLRQCTARVWLVFATLSEICNITKKVKVLKRCSIITFFREQYKR